MKFVLRCTVGVVGGILAIFAAVVGPNYFYAIPWDIRWWAGECLLLAALVGAARLAMRYLPRKPWPLIEPADRPHPAWDRAVAVLLWGISLSFAYPLFQHGDDWGGLGDWDLHLQWYEALHISIFKHGQFPWWNPWCTGGWLLAAEPQFGLFSVDTVLALIFGTKTGLKLALLFDLCLTMEGMRRLATLWFRSPWSVAAATAIYSWNGAIIIAAIGNRAIPMSYPYLPWMLLFAFQIDRGRRYAVGLGVVTAMSVLNVIQYCTFYFMIITALVLAWGFWIQTERDGRRRYLRHIALAAGVFVLLAGERLAVTGLVFTDFPRRLASAIDFEPQNFWDALRHRAIPNPDIYKNTYTMTEVWFPELASYVGIATLLTVGLSLFRGLRWWHLLIVLGFSLSLGAIWSYQPSYWIRDWPIFSSMHVVSRWRFPAMLGLAFAAAQCLEAPTGKFARFRHAFIVPALFIVGDLGVYAQQVLPLAFSIPPAEIKFPEPALGAIQSIEMWELYGNTQTYEALTRGLGVVRGYCPQLGYDRGRKTQRYWRGGPGYVGEFKSGDRAVEPTFWSPNRIEFRLNPKEEIEVNQNPGSWWWINGRPGFPSLRCAEPNVQFLARADDEGRLVLEIKPRGVGLGLGLSIIGAGIAVLAWRVRSPSSKPVPAPTA